VNKRVFENSFVGIESFQFIGEKMTNNTQNTAKGCKYNGRLFSASFY